MSVVLYGMEWCPACQAVLLTCAAVGIDVRLKNVDVIHTNDNNTESYLQMNPAHSIPTLDDNGFNIWESRAILSYLVEQYAKDDHLYPTDPKRRAMVDNVLFFDNGSLYNSFLRYFNFAPRFPMVITNAPPDKVDEERIIDTLTILDTVLSRNAYAAGDRMTIADISLIASLTLPTVYGYQLDAFENIVRWQAKVQSEIPHYDEVGRKGSEKLKDLIRSRVTAIAHFDTTIDCSEDDCVPDRQLVHSSRVPYKND